MKKIFDYEYYLISEAGEIYTTVDTRGNNLPKPRIRRNIKSTKTGYYSIVLQNKKRGLKRKSYYVHRLVAQHYLPNPNNLPCVCHKDDNPANNHVSNLFWGTYSDNNLDKTKKNRHYKGASVLQYDLEGNFIAKYSSVREVREKTGYNIYGYMSGYSNAPGNFQWKYEFKK